MASKQKVLSVSGIVGGALVWGLMWYPYRALQMQGVSGELATVLTYAIAFSFGLFFLGPLWRELRGAGAWTLGLMLSAGWANLGYVLAILEGEVMRVLLLFYLAPLWTVLFAYLVLGEKLDRYGYAVVALSFCGALVMLWQPGMGPPLPHNRAEWFGLTAGMSFAVLNVLVRRTQHLSVNFKSACIWFGTALLTALPFLYRGDLVAQVQGVTPASWVLLGLLGVVLCATSLIVQYGLTHLPANQAIVLFLSELVFAAIASYLLAGEEMALREYLGAALIVSASLLSGRMHATTEPVDALPHVKEPQ